MDYLRFLAGLCGNITALFLYLSPSITFKRIIRDKSTGEFSAVPYAMALLNCLLFAWYGLPFVSPKNLLVTTINGTGAAIESIYLVIFLVYAPNKEKLKLVGVFTFVISVFSTVTMVSLFGLHGNSRKLLCGLSASVFCIVMYGAPLSVMRMVIKTKSVEFMPFMLSLCVFFCSTSWLVFGLLSADPFISVPNGVGCGLGITQLILYAVYRTNTTPAGKATKDYPPRINAEKAHQNKCSDYTHVETRLNSQEV